MAINSSNSLIAKNTLILNIRLVIVLAINLIVSRLVLKNLGIEDYGLYALVGGFVSLLSIITSSITGTAQRFITYELGKSDKNILSITFSNILNALYLIAIVVIFIGTFIGVAIIRNYLNIPVEKNDTALFVYFCSLIVFVINLIIVPYIALINAHEHMHYYAIVSVSDAVMKLSVAIALMLFPSSRLEIYASLLIVISVIDYLLYYLYDKKNFPEAKFHRHYDKRIVKNMFSFSIWMGVGSAAGIIKDQAGSILINLFFGLTLNASMGIANQVRSLLGQFANNIGIAIAPQITKSYADGQINRSIRLTFFRTKCQGIFILFISIPILIYTEEILSLWFGYVPEYTVFFVRQMCIVSILNSLAQGFGPLFLAIGEIKQYQIFGSVLLLTYIPFTYIVLQLTHDPRLCLLFNIIFELLFVILNYYILKIKVNFPYGLFMNKVIARLSVCFVFTLAGGECIKYVVSPDYLFAFIADIILTLIIFILVSYIIVLDESEKTLVIDYIRTKLK